MAIHSDIEWCHATLNFWYGCHKVSDGCKFCYMFRDMPRYGRDPNIVKRSKTFHDSLKWARSGKLKPGSLIFVCSWSDFFIEDADDWRNEAWDIIRRTPEFIYLILTKRPENIQGRLPIDWPSEGYPNVWLGVTAENQEQADKRIPILLQIPAAVRFVSIEPMLGAIDLKCGLGYDYHDDSDDQNYTIPSLNWVIVGAESGPKARPCHPLWMASIVKQCKSADVPVFIKQIQGYVDSRENSRLKIIKDINRFPNALRIRQYPHTGEDK